MDAMGLAIFVSSLLVVSYPGLASDCTLSKGCFPAASNIAYGRAITANSTCGIRAATFHIPQSQVDSMDICNASNTAKSHPASKANDNDAVSFWKARNYEFFVTLQLNFSFSMRLERSMLTFRTFRPNRMILEKSSDFGATWQPYQYYSSTCLPMIPDGLFQGLRGGSYPANSTEAICTTENSIPNSPTEYGTVVFDATRFGDNRYDNSVFVRHVVVTNLRARFRNLDTFGDDVPETSSKIRSKYFYAVTEWRVDGHCFCNGHADECVQRGSESLLPNQVPSGCNCKHNTTGDHCDLCLPLYNNRPWQRGNSTSANECEACECNQHSESCVYNDTKGYGVCQNCLHNTVGDRCGECLSLHYHNSSVDFHDPTACIACGCNVNGSLSLQCDGDGKCSCKANTEGRRCNQCKAGFFGLAGTLVDGCQACLLCNDSVGTSPRKCDPVDGSCLCKANVGGQLCDSCMPGLYNFDPSNPHVCSACGCSKFTALSSDCDETTGQCDCLPGLTGRTCNQTVSARYVPYLEGVIYEAEDAHLDGAVSVAESRTAVTVFTGRGYARMFALGDRVVWWVTTPMRTIVYTFIVRYRAERQVSFVTVNITGNGRTGLDVCDDSNAQNVGGEIHFANISLQAAPFGNGSLRVDACVSAGSRIRVAVTYSVIGVASQLFIDSVIVMPKREYVEPFKSLIIGSELYNRTSLCYDERELVSSHIVPLTPTCRDHTFLANVWLFNGSLACGCSGKGSINGNCESIGGDCMCRSNVITRTCSRCDYNYFNLSITGCEACECSSLLSDLARPCDSVTGQCDCRPFTTGLKCQSCIENYFNISNCQPCDCNPDTSENLQCDTDGECKCNSGIAGTKCDDGCLPNHYRLTKSSCASCKCSSLGSVDAQCRNLTGECSCKERTTGTSCDMCRDGFFDFSANNVDVCLECFCYNHSRDCDSARGFDLKQIKSTFPNFDTTDGWTGITNTGMASVVSPGLDLSRNSNIVLKGDSFFRFTYFVAPPKFLNVLHTSYAQTLEFDLSLVPNVANGTLHLMTMAAGDILIKSRSALEPIVAVLNELPGTLFHRYKVQLVASQFFWGSATGPSVTVGEMFDVLRDAEYLRIRGDFGQGTFADALLDNVVLGAAELARVGNLTNVANCSCPDGHEGIYCENCEKGYKRSVVNGTAYDSCVPCDCNGHSNDCDVKTGVCIDCNGNTQGDACDECRPGYYRDASGGVTDDCLPCPCPLTNGTNQFSQTCRYTSDDGVVCDGCPESHTGSRCEECSDGHFGRPTVLGSICRPCTCNRNINLNETGNCNTTTGECLKCVNNTSGLTCNQCSDGFFGDAIHGTCEECGCKVTGSRNQSCFGISGTCTCLPGVTGSKCDRCLPLHYGYNSGSGCVPCNCDPLGARHDNCKSDSGQCSCKAGVEENSRTCSTCKDGFYSLSDAGCRECVCNVSNTRGGSNTCNKISGQCPCLSGVTGLPCVACKPNALGSPPNCTLCGDCYSNWTLLIDQLMSKIEEEDGRFSGMVRVHYGVLTEEQRIGNVTMLRDSYNVITNFTSDPLSSNETRIELVNTFNKLLSSYDIDEDLYMEIPVVVRQTKEIVSRSMSFNGLVLVVTGVYQSNRDVDDLAASLNMTADRVEVISRDTVDHIKLNATAVIASKTRAERAQLTIRTAVRTSQQARGDIDFVFATLPDFNSLSENSSTRLISLTAERERIRKNLTEDLGCVRNASLSGLGANTTAQTALATAQLGLNSTRTQVNDSEHLSQDAETAFQAACKIFYDTNSTKSEADGTVASANEILFNVSALDSLLNASARSLNTVNETASNVFDFSLPDVADIQQLSQQINETIIPEAEINSTIEQARDSRTQANDVLFVASSALNVSKRAADIVADIENLLSNSSRVREMTEQKIRDTLLINSSIHTSAAEIPDVTENVSTTAMQSRGVSGPSLDTVGRVKECRLTALSKLEVSDAEINHNCNVTGVYLLQNATNLHKSAKALVATQVHTNASSDRSKLNDLEQSAADALEQVTRSSLILRIKKLLDSYMEQKVVLISKRERLRLLEIKLDSLLRRVESCGNSK